MKQRKAIRTVIYYDDGSYEEIHAYQPYKPIDPYGTFPAPFTPNKPIWAETNTCPKCGLKIEGVMGYCCPTPHCPTGLGGVYCGVSLGSAGVSASNTNGYIVSGSTVQYDPKTPISNTKDNV